jgi:zinc resistance-associated protein
MWKAALAGALALATMEMSFARADGASETLVPRGPAQVGVEGRNGAAFRLASTGNASTDFAGSRIAQFKSALRLTAEQERHWPAVEAALRDMIRRHESDEMRAGGLMQRIGDRAASVMLNAGALKRLVAAAQPLIKSLDSEQKRGALHLARNMGFGEAASKFE